MRILQKIWHKLLMTWWSVSIPLRLKLSGVTIGKNVRFYGMPIVSLAPNSKIELRDRSVLCSDSRFTALGVSHPVVLRTLRAGAEIVIGEDSGISGGTVCAAVSVRIGRECMFGADVMVVDTDFHAVKAEGRRRNQNEEDIAAKPIVLQDNVFLGSRSTVLKGVSIGANSIVGAGSVVVKDVSRDSIFGGNPSRIIASLESL